MTALAQMLAADSSGGGIRGHLVLLALAVFFLSSYLRDRRKAPHLPCRACGGRGRRDSDWRDGAWGPCPSCGGSGRRPRTGGGDR